MPPPQPGPGSGPNGRCQMSLPLTPMAPHQPRDRVKGRGRGRAPPPGRLSYLPVAACSGRSRPLYRRNRCTGPRPPASQPGSSSSSSSGPGLTLLGTGSSSLSSGLKPPPLAFGSLPQHTPPTPPPRHPRAWSSSSSNSTSQPLPATPPMTQACRTTCCSAACRTTTCGTRRGRGGEGGAGARMARFSSSLGTRGGGEWGQGAPSTLPSSPSPCLATHLLKGRTSQLCPPGHWTPQGQAQGRTTMGLQAWLGGCSPPPPGPFQPWPRGNYPYGMAQQQQQQQQPQYPASSQAAGLGLRGPPGGPGGGGAPGAGPWGNGLAHTFHGYSPMRGQQNANGAPGWGQGQSQGQGQYAEPYHHAGGAAGPMQQQGRRDAFALVRLRGAAGVLWCPGKAVGCLHHSWGWAELG